MKKILLLLSFLAAFFVSNAQYPVIQYLGRDSSLVDSRGGLKARLINYAFTDTTEANTQRISQYPGAMIYTTSGGDKLWLRSSDATLWTRVGTTSGGGSVVDSIKMVGNEFLLYQTGGSDLNAYISPTILDIDSTFTPLAGQVNDTTWRLKSLRVQAGDTTINPDITDSTVNINIPMVQVDTSGVTNNMVAYWDTAGVDKVKFKTITSGSSGSGAFSKLEWFTGDELAPAIGDSILVHDSFPGKFLDVYRNGIKQPHVYNDTGFYRLTDTTIKFIPYFAANEFYHIEARDSTAYTQLVLQEPSAPPSTTIAYVSSTNGGNNGGGSNSRTFSHTTGSGTDRYLLVGFMGDVISGADDVSSVTYNGVSMTLIGKHGTSNTGNRFVYLYGLANPTTGANNVVITMSSSHFILAAAAEYSGVQGVDTYTTADAFTTSKTTSITTGANNCWTVLLGSTNSLVQTAGTGATKRVATTGDYVTFFDSNAAITPAGSYSMTTDCSLGSGIGHIIVSLKPY